MNLDRFFGSIVFRVGCLLAAVAVVILFGVLGVGHGGLSSTNLDARFLYLAGIFWRKGLSPYSPSAIDVDPDLIEVLSRYDFAYPPHMAPFCMLLAAFPLAQAKIFMTCINVVAALALGYLAARFARPEWKRTSDETSSSDQWLIAALIIGNFSVAYVIWAGQTTLLITLALLAGWHYARRGNWMIGGILIGIAAIKPQLMIAIILWLLFEQRWRVLVIAALTVAVFAIVPMSIAGPIDLIAEWYSAILRYPNAEYNSLGSRMVFGLSSMLHSVSLPAPKFGLFILIVLVGALWYFRSRILSGDILPLLLGLSLFFGYAHGYDLVILAPMVPAFWRHLKGRAAASLAALGLFLVITLPNSIFEPFGIPLLLHARVLALLVCIIWLCWMSVRQTSGWHRAPIGSATGGTPNRVAI